MERKSRVTKANRMELEAARDHLQGFPKYLPKILLESQAREAWAALVSAQVAFEEVMDRVKLRSDPATKMFQDGAAVEDTIYRRVGTVVSFQGHMLRVEPQSKLPYIAELYKVELVNTQPDGSTYKETLVLPKEHLRKLKEELES